MPEALLESAERSLAGHGAFEKRGEEYAVTTTPFDATVRVDAAGEMLFYEVSVSVPTLDATVEAEEVAPVVQEGWFETFERRIEHPGGTTRVDPGPPLVTLNLESDEVHVEIGFETTAPARGTEDAKALVDFVEGTYVQGIVPGYEYRDPVAGLIQQAEDRSEGAGGPPL
ncbi:MAG: DUF5813 family protein [Halobacteriales archaeon]